MSLVWLAALTLGTTHPQMPQTNSDAVVSSADAIDPAPVVAEIRAAIAQHYVLPERRAAIDAALASGLAAGRYRAADPRVWPRG